VRRPGGVALLGASLLAAAYVFDAAVLFVPGIALALVGLLMPVWIWLAARGTTVSRVLHEDRVIEDQPLEATIQIRRGPFSVARIELLDPLARDVVTLRPFISPLGSSKPIEARIIARFSRRGRRHFEPPAVALSDPLGLVRTVRAGSSTAEDLLVLPRTERVRWVRRDPGERLDTGAAQALVETLASTEVDGLRPYRPGTPASRISWPALARGAGLLERRLRSDRDSGPLVVLDVRCSGSPARVDAAVRAAASLTLELARRSGCDLLVPGERRPAHIDGELGAWPGMHARLALIEGGPDAHPPSLDPRPRIGQVFYVAAEAGRLALTLARANHSTAVLVLPEEVEPPIRTAVSFEVSGCRGYLLASAANRARVRERAA
jgi:uncharacterized protein (DUF58 family)